MAKVINSGMDIYELCTAQKKKIDAQEAKVAKLKACRDDLNQLNRAHQANMISQTDQIRKLRKGLSSIAMNTCCLSCQEARLVASQALEEVFGE